MTGASRDRSVGVLSLGGVGCALTQRPCCVRPGSCRKRAVRGAPRPPELLAPRCGVAGPRASQPPGVWSLGGRDRWVRRGLGPGRGRELRGGVQSPNRRAAEGLGRSQVESCPSWVVTCPGWAVRTRTGQPSLPACFCFSLPVCPRWKCRFLVSECLTWRLDGAAQVEALEVKRR